MRQRIIFLFFALLGVSTGAQADVWLSNYKMEVGDDFGRESGMYCVVAGHIVYVRTGCVRLENAELMSNSSVNNVLSSDESYLEVELLGKNKITVSGDKSAFLFSGRTLVFTGTGTLEIEAATDGIEAGDDDQTIEVRDVTVSTKGGHYGINGLSTSIKLTGTALLNAWGGTSSMKGIDGFLSDCYVLSPGGAWFNEDEQTVVFKDGNPTRDVQVSLVNAVEIIPENFPDTDFRDWLLRQEYGQDGIIYGLEMSAVTEMSMAGQGIGSLKGIERFTELRQLNCSNNQLTTLDLSGNPNLESLSCYNNQLTDLNVKGIFQLEYLNCSYNQLSSLDVGGTALKELYCYGNHLRTSGLTTLVQSLPYRWKKDGNLYVYNDEPDGGNMIPVPLVDMAKRQGYKVLAWNAALTMYEEVEGEPVVVINEDNFPDEAFRNYIFNKITENEFLDIDNIANKFFLDVSKQNITDLTGIEHFTALKELDCSYNALTTLDLSKNTALEYLYCQNNALTTLDLSKNTALKNLYCQENTLTSLDLPESTALKLLVCYNNALTTLDLSKNTALAYLNCGYNALTTLDLSKNTALAYLDCGYNALTTLDLSKNTALETLKCPNNTLTTLDLSKNTALAYLDCSYNALTTLELRANPSVNIIHCECNAISGQGTETLVNSLPETEGGKIYFFSFVEDDFNEATTIQVETAKRKHWEVLMYVDDSGLEDYEGLDPGLPIDEASFPDESFRNWLMEQDYGKDRHLSTKERANVLEMSLFNQGIASLKGIELFSALTTLNCSRNLLTTLDLSNNISLKKVECQKNAIRGEGMDALVNSLPVTDSGTLCVYANELPTGNAITWKQVEVAESKHWHVQMLNEANVWVDCSRMTLGDVNGDGKVDEADVEKTISYVEQKLPEGFIFLLADVDKDGKVDWKDIDQLRETVGLPTGITRTERDMAEGKGSASYDLQGRRVKGQARKGVYVRNGRKLVVKH